MRSRMRSTRSPGSSARDTSAREAGAAIVEFSMLAVLLSSIFLVVLQVGLYLYQRSVIASSAMSAARYAANANVETQEGAARASSLIAGALSDDVVAGLTCAASNRTGADGVVLVVVECQGAIPSIVTALGDLLPIEVSAQAIAEGQ